MCIPCGDGLLNIREVLEETGVRMPCTDQLLLAVVLLAHSRTARLGLFPIYHRVEAAYLLPVFHRTSTYSLMPVQYPFFLQDQLE